MTRRSIVLVLGVVVPALILTGVAVFWRTGDPRVRAKLVAPAAEASGFAHADGPRELSFPLDYGPHPDYQTEWWYYTGNLQTADGQHFGYELTFFRRALVPLAEQEDRPSLWATNQVYLAHFAVTDVGGQRFQAFERASRGAAGLAGAQAVPYGVWLEDWRVDETGPGTFVLRATQDNLAVDLQLTDRKGPVLQGDRGYSQKGPEPGNASYYYSQTRLESAGTVRVADKAYAVDGLSWMDHEYSTSSLSADEVGWDWFALQLDDGSELMVYEMRKADGSASPFSSGTLIASDGQVQHLTQQDFQVSVDAKWRSPHSGVTYPARWTLKVPGAGLTLKVEPYLADQELDLSYAYWEGAVHFTGERAGRPISGSGYVELTGYATSMRGQL